MNENRTMKPVEIVLSRARRMRKDDVGEGGEFN
jgi:hypothetical protein